MTMLQLLAFVINSFDYTNFFLFSCFFCLFVFWDVCNSDDVNLCNLFFNFGGRGPTG
jgi:hypothetical protein